MRIAWPGAGRLTLMALAVVPAAMAYPWQTVTGQWALGIAVVVVIILLAQWRGMFFTTMLKRRIALLGARESGGGAHQLVQRTEADAQTTAVLRVLPESDGDLPLDVIAGYLDRYGLRCEAVRVTSRNTPGERTTWIGLTMSAATNLTELQARSPRIPLRDTAEVTLRRLADHLRELGWAVTTSEVDVPDILGPQAKPKWRAVQDGEGSYVTAYAIDVNDALPETLDKLWAYSSPEVWTAVQITPGVRVAAAAAIRTDELPDRGGAPLAGLNPLRGYQLEALDALSPNAADPLPGARVGTVDVAALRWPAGAEKVRT
ncbi:type VII secretion protein EccE [[Mycobacterium] wendilense]|uniref:Type VII secretion protein EccE n=1 Tax=[Mycobacterium] wendilense TaxID=3064284 RepID=A0ABN9P5R6_9MYCO|nr:type VII secretion protein EccE [Mycolicibacterium sp. MU0050]CAJ1586203.1 type VII secretion protein EccE [Mycolicibacterium sp. MU0050]